MTERISLLRAVAFIATLTLLVAALPLVPSAQAATTGFTIDQTDTEVLVDEQANFVVRTTVDADGVTPDTVIAVSDNSSTGSFFDGTATGNCNQTSPDADDEFGIGLNKGVCYSNSEAGTYTITAVLLNASSTPIAEPQTITIIVSEPVVDTATSTDPVATSTDNGSQNATSTDTATGTSTATSTDDTTGTTTDNSSDDAGDTGSNASSNNDDAADKCEYEGHKYDQAGNPLEGWDMGLIKVITYEGQTYVYTISTDVTDADGFYCLRWSDSWTPAYDAADFPNGYTFEYRVYETKQADWEFITAEHGPDIPSLKVATLDELTFTETQVQLTVGEPNGFVYADAEYHVDFYNRYFGSTTDTGGGDDEFAPLTLTPVCRVTGGGMTFNITNNNAFAIDAVYQVVATTDTATVTVAALGVTSFTTATATDAGTTTLSYLVASSSYSTSTVAATTPCEQTNISQGGSGGSGGGGGSSSGTRVGSRNNNPEPTVAGISDSPEPLVLGEQVSAVPLGGANTGAGGAAPTTPSLGALLLIASLALAVRSRRLNV